MQKSKIIILIIVLLALSYFFIPFNFTGYATNEDFSNKVTEDIPIDKGIAQSTTIGFNWELDYSDLKNFQDATINFQNEDYNIHEILAFATNSPSIETSLTSSDDDYETNVFMEVTGDSMKYYFLFDESINISKATSNEPLEIKFLDKTLRITKVDPSCTTGSCNQNEFTAYVGAEYFMRVDNTITVNDKKVTLYNVASDGSVQVDVDGTFKIISLSSTKTINGIEISNKESFYEDTLSERAAQLVIGRDATATYKDGDAYVGEDENDPNWVWDIGNLGGKTTTTIDSSLSGHTGPYLGIENDFIKDDDTDNPVGIGECYYLPNNYASICLDSLTVPSTDYLTLIIEFKDNVKTSESQHIRAGDNAGVIHIYSPKSDTLEVPSGVLDSENITLPLKTKEVWLQKADASDLIDVYAKHEGYNPSMRYIGNIDVSSEKQFLEVNYKKTKDDNIKFIASKSGSDHRIKLDINGDSTNELSNNADDIFIDFAISNGNYSSLGSNLASAEASELLWSNSLTEIGEKDENHRTIYGIIIRDPKSNGASDQVVLEIPGYQVQANVVVSSGYVSLKPKAGAIESFIPDIKPSQKLKELLEKFKEGKIEKETEEFVEEEIKEEPKLSKSKINIWFVGVIIGLIILFIVYILISKKKR